MRVKYSTNSYNTIHNKLVLSSSQHVNKSWFKCVINITTFTNSSKWSNFIYTPLFLIQVTKCLNPSVVRVNIQHAVLPGGSLNASPVAGLRCPSCQVSSTCLQVLSGGRCSPSGRAAVSAAGGGAPRKTRSFDRSHMKSAEEKIRRLV